ncbi:MAG: hypothetical protein HRF52_12750 [Ignavibacterium sp.]|jgi:hypothetical protein|uniref:hypothetical protein n=1 Tax=Ignavibacterium sp. TaxID=2651167 RepID=UPI0032975976
MTLKTELNKLFEEWEQKFPNYKGKFVKDGILDEQLYQDAKTKILYITKDPNDPDQTSWDLADLLNQSLEGNFAIRLAEWSYGILNDFPPLSSLTDYNALHQALRSTAVINLKKIGGESQAKTDDIFSHTTQNKSYLQRQIKLISPEIIIGGVGDTKIWTLLFDDIDLIRSDYDILVGKWDNIMIVDYYHPSYQVPRAMSYSLLQNIFRCKTFADLRTKKAVLHNKA